jgi:hypothetical protein
LKRNLLLIFLFCISFLANAQTNVSGFINANTTWTLAGSPYIVVGNALLSHGYTLTIDPGVVVKFDTGRVLQIDGELIAVGTAANRITFTSNQTNPAAGDWGKIHFADTSIDAVFDTAGNYVSGCVMKYCNALYGGGIGFGIIHNERSMPYFSNCRIENSLKNGIYAYGDYYRIDSSVVKDCQEYGLYFTQPIIDAGVLLIQKDSIVFNKGGIFLGGHYDSVHKEISQSVFLNNTINAAIFSSAIKNIHISENVFVNNVVNNGVIHFGTSNFYISCNKFINNQSENGAINAVGFGSYISSNLFENNSSNSGTSAITASVGDDSACYIINNIIKNNTSPNGSCCVLTPIWWNTEISMYVNNNSFIGNSGLSTIKFLTAWPATDPSNRSLHFKYNNFQNSTNYEIYNAVDYGQQNIYADSNYWGSISTSYIDSNIYDFFDYGNLSVVYYSPILTSPVTIDTVCHLVEISVPETETSNSPSTLFPNPFTTTSTLSLATSIRNATLTIYNLYGQIMQRQDGISGKEITIDRKNLEAGIYVYEATQGGRRVCAGKAVVY